MKTIVIYGKNGQTILYQGIFPSFKACVEAAVESGASLAHANFRHKNLSNASLDGAYMPHADFSHADLTGANISESCLHRGDFSGASLYNTCLADSDLTQCNFETAFFGATNMDGSDISHSSFSSLSCFTLDYDVVKDMGHCIYKDVDGTISRMSHPPLVIKGRRRQPIILLDEHIKIDGLTFSYGLEKRDLPQFLQNPKNNFLKRKNLIKR